jgi:alpha-ketoglutarate-dependent taurine dioxygenase
MSSTQEINLEQQGWHVLEPDRTIAANMEQAVLALACKLGTISINGDYPPAMKLTPEPGAKDSYFKTDGEIPLHTDEAWWPGLPSRFIVMGCERPAADGGGVTLLADAKRSFIELSDDQQTLLATMSLWIPAPPHHKENAGMVSVRGINAVPRTVVEIDTNGLPTLVRLNPNQKFYDLNRDQPESVEAVRKWDTINRGLAEKILLEPGQITIIDNHRAVHARTAFDDPNRVQWRAYANPM